MIFSPTLSSTSIFPFSSPVPPSSVVASVASFLPEFLLASSVSLVLKLPLFYDAPSPLLSSSGEEVCTVQ
jgi:hypothetical protein